MLPSGAPTEETVAALSKPLESGDAIIDGVNPSSAVPELVDSLLFLSLLRLN
jgi:6-phosphogluconate dehydrogenase (decarboxylating)